jgi:uncharacterized protein (DUF58 family)
MSLNSEKTRGAVSLPGNEAVEVSLNELIGLNRLTGRFSLNNLKIRSILSGQYISKVKGRDMEFDEVRLYAPGDDVRCLDWRVTARTGKVHTKLYREERERPIFLATDYRSTMFFATRGVFKSVLAAKLAALIAWSGTHHADRVGGQIFTDRDTLEFKPRRGKSGILHLLKHLADFSSILRETRSLDGRVVDRDRGVVPADESLGSALERLDRHVRPGNLIFLLSDFRGLNSQTESSLLRLSRHCDVVPILIYDSLERQLPERGNYRITNGEKRITLELSDDRYRAEYLERFQQRQQRLRRLAITQRMKLLECCTVDEPLEILMRLLAVNRA